MGPITIERSSYTCQRETIVTESSAPQPEEIITKSSSPAFEEIITEDGILSLIVSSLTLIEAVRTSVLSSRWRHLWPCLRKFDFNAITVLDARTLRVGDLDGEEAYNLTKGKTAKFIRSVHSVLQHLQGARVDEFTVGFFLHKIHSHHIDAWVRFAIESKTKKLGILLFRPFTNTWIEPYDFPCQLLASSHCIEKLTLVICSLRLPIKFDGLSHLKELALGDVDVTEEDFNYIMSNCSSTLVKLVVLMSRQWESISIPHSLTQLETLIVIDCFQLWKIEANAVNLLKLEYRGAPVEFKFRQSKQLKKAHITFNTGSNAYSLGSCMTNLSSSLPHLESLTLRISSVSKVENLPKGLSCFIHLKLLDWEWKENFKVSLFHLATLLGAAPLLQELKLQLSTKSTRVIEQPPETPSKFREILPKTPHTYLKTVRVSGFYFDRWQIEIAAYLLNIAPNIQSMTIEKGSKASWFVSNEIDERGMQILRQEAPTEAELVLLVSQRFRDKFRSPGPALVVLFIGPV